MRYLKTFPLEAAIWLGALLALGLMDPAGGRHITLCPIAGMGFDFCPGCGLGRSISWLLHGAISESLQAHPLGIVTAVVLIGRTTQLVKSHFAILWQK